MSPMIKIDPTLEATIEVAWNAFLFGGLAAMTPFLTGQQFPQGTEWKVIAGAFVMGGLTNLRSRFTASPAQASAAAAATKQ